MPQIIILTQLKSSLQVLLRVGQLAAATALSDSFTEKTDDLGISCVPAALVLFNPVIDNSPAGYGYGVIGEHYRFFSSLHNIKKGAPPTLIMLGREDRLIPTATAGYYKTYGKSRKHV